MIKKLFIKGLFFEKDVSIDFSFPYKILVSENGYGKTTILNTFYSLVSGDFSRLREIDFDSIGIVFESGKTVSINKYEISDVNKKLVRFANKISGKDLGEKQVKDLISFTNNTGLGYEYDPNVIEKFAIKNNMPISIAHKIVMYKWKYDDFDYSSKLQSKIELIRDELDLDVLYLPTYRRVEKKFEGISLSKKNDWGDMQINFGMSDVESSINRITSEIKTSSFESFSKLNGHMLTQFAENSTITHDMKSAVANYVNVKIVLDRLSDNISERHKKSILHLVESQKIMTGHDPLIYLLSNLLEVYKQQSHNDTALKNFAVTCNNYLNGKQIYYDESAVTVKVVRNKNKSEINLEDLSSGEKQILSIFSLLYLGKKNRLALFFDEPELSLSIEWQKRLLPDIIASNKCAFLLATTHSPFIFSNDLKKHTVDLSYYIEEL
ncbi:AAA family ATPase [Cobetia marina]|uniref:AAA family ATPase n=1 Tax=Cobetia marina TaxID=28258 RepID=UPI0025484525|nr:AAA family ATPase [Cobetia pacifica]MDI6002881.1 AAA family ATPase [Cobetia pacifica]